MIPLSVYEQARWFDFAQIKMPKSPEQRISFLLLFGKLGKRCKDIGMQARAILMVWEGQDYLNRLKS